MTFSLLVVQNFAQRLIELFLNIRKLISSEISWMIIFMKGRYEIMHKAGSQSTNEFVLVESAGI